VGIRFVLRQTGGHQGDGVFSTIRKDALETIRAQAAHLAPGQTVSKLQSLAGDSFGVFVWQRTREYLRRLHIPLANRIIRRVLLAVYGIDLGNDIVLGHGVSFVHTVGIVIGGTARVGDRVRFMGSNTVGTAKDNGYPVIEDDVEIGAGARILGPIRIGARSVIGANAVVVVDVPPDSVAVGIPARLRPRA
jgi:serine O-acetyltransferase